jgi:EAL domain-containing protein (putative c-di-GMP-specific phosphodiesterase class I)
MVSTFRKLGFKMTAEGVEDEEMAKVMTEVGVDYLQGYCFSKPIPMEDFVENYFVR